MRRRPLRRSPTRQGTSDRRRAKCPRSSQPVHFVNHLLAEFRETFVGRVGRRACPTIVIRMRQRCAIETFSAEEESQSEDCIKLPLDDTVIIGVVIYAPVFLFFLIGYHTNSLEWQPLFLAAAIIAADGYLGRLGTAGSNGPVLKAARFFWR